MPPFLAADPILATAVCLPAPPAAGPHIPWRPGRSDYAPQNFVALPDGRLPDGDKDAKHVRDIFYRWAGFSEGGSRGLHWWQCEQGQAVGAWAGAHVLRKAAPLPFTLISKWGAAVPLVPGPCRMGFNDQEIVALCGAHTLGRCHDDRSGFVGPWTNGEGRAVLEPALLPFPRGCSS